jgi:hypothetical protein
MVPSKLQKKQLPRDTRSKPGQQAEKYAQLGFRHHKHAWPEPLQKPNTARTKMETKKTNGDKPNEPP